MPKRKSTDPRNFSNLYRFIRLILGTKIPDRRIAMRWDMDVKNFHDFKHGKHPVPRVERLVPLAEILNVDDHFVYEVAKGTPAQRVYHMIKKLHLKGRCNLAPRSMGQAYKTLSESEERYRKLFHHAGDAIMAVDIKTGSIINCNKKTEQLTGYSCAELGGRHFTLLYPEWRHRELLGRFSRRARWTKYVKRSISYLLRKDKRLVPLFITTNILELDGRLVLQGILREPSKLKLKH